MSGDIVERLRSWHNSFCTHDERSLYQESADEIERLRAALPLLVASASLRERSDIARGALEADR